MTKRTWLIGLLLWGVEFVFLLFMILFTQVTRHPLFWPVIGSIFVVLLPINLLVARKMPGGNE